MFRGNSGGRRHAALAALLAAALLSGCYQKMGRHPAYDPYEPSPFFSNGSSARPLVEGTVAHGTLREDELLYTGKQNGQLADVLPVELNQQLLDRGEERYNIYCSMCHGRTGLGDGMIVRRGYKRPPSFHDANLKTAKIGHFYDVMTNGFGVMPSYAAQVPVQDRWAIAAYVRALQMTRSATVADVPPAELAKLESGGEK
jgi:mono/diheme cytochrome c family protein